MRHQFEVEKDLAIRLRASNRQGRTELFKTLYNELFERVPDHARLTRRETPESSARSVNTQLNLLRPALGPDKVLLEFAPGDCRLSKAAAPLVKKVIGVDISDQRSATDVFPENFDLIVYDGYNLPIPDASVDAVFSYQFLEHLHPDDVEPHFAMIARVLKPGGAYVFDTPHRFSGPHDVARYFTQDLVCLHMQEWTYRELRAIVHRQGFSKTFAYRSGKPLRSAIGNLINDGIEGFLDMLPRSLRWKLSQRFFASVAMMAVKG
jgi:SAM-dependent methyltransferase